MVCPKCTFEFCWDCLDHMPGYEHDFGEDCPARVMVMYGQIGGLAAFYCCRLLRGILISILQMLIPIFFVALLFKVQTGVEKKLRHIIDWNLTLMLMKKSLNLIQDLLV